MAPCDGQDSGTALTPTDFSVAILRAMVECKKTL